jgi:uncharacterized membrane protein
MPAYYTPTAGDAASLCEVRAIPLLRPFAWLRQGWRDIHRSLGPSLLHGFVVALGGILMLGLAARWPALLPGAFSGFVIVGPILATGLYELSRVGDEGRRPNLGDVISAWRRGTRPLVWLGVLLFLAGTLWVLVSTVIFKLFVHAPITDPLAFLRYAVGSQGNLLFLMWTLLGGLGAAVLFAATVVSAPLLLDRDIELRDAVTVSLRAVGRNPAAMAVWAALIMLLTALSVATLSVGFTFAVPVIGHATWHAYRDLVDAHALPRRR